MPDCADFRVEPNDKAYAEFTDEEFSEDTRITITTVTLTVPAATYNDDLDDTVQEFTVYAYDTDNGIEESDAFTITFRSECRDVSIVTDFSGDALSVTILGEKDEALFSRPKDSSSNKVNNCGDISYEFLLDGLDGEKYEEDWLTYD